MRIFEDVTVSTATQIKCDRCGAGPVSTSMEGGEFLCYSDRGGYFSCNDGALKEIDLCEKCVYEVLGTWLRVTDEPNWSEI